MLRCVGERDRERGGGRDGGREREKERVSGKNGLRLLAIISDGQICMNLLGRGAEIVRFVSVCLCLCVYVSRDSQICVCVSVCL